MAAFITKRNATITLTAGGTAFLDGSQATLYGMNYL